MANVVRNEVIDFDYSDLASYIESKGRLERELLSSRIGPDVFVRFNILGDAVYLHVQRADLYVRYFHLNNTLPWCIDRERANIRNRRLGLGHNYGDLLPGVNIRIGLRRFQAALLDIRGRFSDGGNSVTSEFKSNPHIWISLLKEAIASLVIMVLEPCRSLWLDDDIVRLMREGDGKVVRYLTTGEWRGINNWGDVSARSRQDMENSGWIARTSPVEVVDVNLAVAHPIYARDFIKIRCLTT